MNFYISDLHFGHKNVIKHDSRPFADVDEMDRALIDLWNAKVGEEDQVYIVGDFCYRNARQEQWYLKQLKGHKHLVIGNHDGRLLKNEEAMSYFESVGQIMQIQEEEKEIVLCHFPLATWNKEHYGAWHIYGHVHGNGRQERIDAVEYMRSRPKALNAGCMINNYSPANFSELIANNEKYWSRG